MARSGRGGRVGYVLRACLDEQRKDNRLPICMVDPGVLLQLSFKVSRTRFSPCVSLPEQGTRPSRLAKYSALGPLPSLGGVFRCLAPRTANRRIQMKK